MFLVWLFWCVCFWFGLVSLLHDLSKDVKFFTCLSERALDLRLRLRSLVRFLVDVSQLWPACILEICRSLRGKKKDIVGAVIRPHETLKCCI